MKAILSTMLLLAACGAETDAARTALAGDQGAPWRATTIERDSLTVTAINGGINPDWFGYRIEGSLLLGGNPCYAQGTVARLKESTEGDVIALTPEISKVADGRFCTEEYNPQYARVSIEVRGDSTRVSAVKVRNVGALGVEVLAGDILDGGAGEAGKDVVVADVDFVPTNGGINPDAFAVDVKGTIQKGSNPCAAGGVKVWLAVSVEGRAIHVRPLRDDSMTKGRICTMEYMPVVEKVTTTARGMMSDIDSIVVHNVESMGRSVEHQVN